MPWIRFLAFLFEAFLWKKAEFLSPSLSHNVLDLCLQYVSYCLKRALSWECDGFCSSNWSGEKGCLIISCNFPCMTLNSLCCALKTFLYHWRSSLPVCEILTPIWSIPLPVKGKDQPLRMISIQSAWLCYISSKQNRLGALHKLNCAPISSNSVRWSNSLGGRMQTLLICKAFHAGFWKTLSSLSFVDLQDHVNLQPL